MLAIVSLLLLPSAYAINISGNIGGITFAAENGPFIVDSICTVPKGKTTLIKEGCKFFSASFLGS
jgi:hypothetical protein